MGKLNVWRGNGPRQVNISPPNQTYTATELIGYVGPIKCIADCKPECIMTWNGPDLSDGITSVLQLQNLAKTQAGYYSCNASNNVGSLTSVGVNVIVNYAPTILRLQTLISNTIEEHQPVTFQCEVDSYPAPDITWIFSRTNTLLFKDEHVFKSNYTVPKTMCLQTGSYRCQGSNVIDAVLVNAYREIDLFVLCSVRIDQRYQEPPDNIAVMEKDTFNITVYLISYPKPSISWTMKHPDTGIISTVTNNNSFNVFEHTSTVHIGIMSKNDYGVYKINAFNNIGLQYTKSFSVIPQGPPIQPTDVLVTCEITSMLVSWLPGFNGGITQTFRVSWLNLKTQHTELSPEIMNSTQGQTKQHIVRSLDPGTMYIVYVEALNKHGIVRSTKNANCTTGSSTYEYFSISTINNVDCLSCTKSIKATVTFVPFHNVQHTKVMNAEMILFPALDVMRSKPS
ncbi:unnamed protein product [Mytilus coruscus]|uniref:HMCN n=1 Tax=Mytilus coruscus TaxID=42192 RepID=A0A6J8ATB7_MYTCO|nr:unnamed protein product [Mytilus coruscus]